MESLSGTVGVAGYWGDACASRRDGAGCFALVGKIVQRERWFAPLCKNSRRVANRIRHTCNRCRHVVDPSSAQFSRGLNFLTMQLCQASLPAVRFSMGSVCTKIESATFPHAFS